MPSSRERSLRKQAQDHGYRLVKSQGVYTLVHDGLNAVMYHVREVTLDQVEAFLTEA